ncbi:MAG: hypothetical protein ACP5TJ_01180 [Candidatus Micrarchaeia archaeon]
MDKIRLAKILFLISGILVVLDSVLEYFAFSYLESTAQSANASALNKTYAAEVAKLKAAGPLLATLPIVGVISGIMLLLVGYMLGNGKPHIKAWAATGILFSLVSITGNGGFIIGLILGLAAGVVALTA